MAPIHRRPSSRPRMSHHLRRTAVFSSLLLILSISQLSISPRLLDFSSELIATRPSEGLQQHSSMLIKFSPNVQNGLGAQVLHLLDAAALAQLVGPAAKLCVAEGRYWNYGCAPRKGWSCYFSTLACIKSPPCAELSRLSPRAVWASNCIRISTHASARRAASLMRRLAHDHPVSSAAYVRHVASSVWRLNAGTAARVSSTVKQTQLKPARYVAVHIRRGDKSKEVQPISVQQYAAAITLLATRGESVFVATDDGRILPSLRVLLPHNPLITLPSAASRIGHNQARHNRVWMKLRYDDVKDLLAEIELMRRSRIFVSTFSSNLARLVHVLRNADERDSVSLDDRWAPGVAWHTFGQSYCHWPGSNTTFCRVWDSSR